MSQIKKILKSRLFENFVSLGIIQGVNYILPLITIPFLFNQLGVEKYGLVNFSFAFIQYFIMITDFGFGLSGTRYIAEHREDKEIVNRYLNSATISRACMATLSFLILVLLTFMMPKFAEYKLFTFLFFGQVIGNVLNPEWFFRGMERMKFNTIIHITTRLVSILPLFVIIRKPEDYLYIPICYSGGAIIAGLISFRLIRKQFDMRFFFTTVSEIWQVTRDSGKFFLSRLSVSLFTNTNTFVLGLVCGNIAVGYYSLADKIYVALNSVYGPINGAIFPYMTKNKNLDVFKKIFYYGFCFNLVMLVCFYLLFPYVYPILFNDFADESMNVLNILLVANILCFPSTLLGYPFLAAWGHPNYCNYSIVAVSAFHLLAISFLYVLNLINIYSVATIVVLSETVLLSIRIIGVKKFKLWN